MHKFTFISLIIFTFKFSAGKGKALVFTKQIINCNYICKKNYLRSCMPGLRANCQAHRRQFAV